MTSFMSEQSIKNVTVVASGNNNKVHSVLVGSVTGLDIGHVVVITAAGLQGRWDGDAAALPTEPFRFGIVIAKQFDGDGSVKVLVKGNYVRNNVVIADDSALTAAQQFLLTTTDLWDEGTW